MNTNKGKLIIIPTPIGNLSDVTYRAVDVLKSVDAIYAEDTRVTDKLLKFLNIKKPIIRLDEQIMSKRLNNIIERAKNGEIIGYCSDAGMPAVSDPGARLVEQMRLNGVEVEVLPGPSAVPTAYVASGTQFGNFYFGGFFPRKENDAKCILESLSQLNAALIFFESPKRLLNSLKVIADYFPSRDVSVCRELTKLHEEVVRASAQEILKIFTSRAEKQSIKGEIVIVIDGISEKEVREKESIAVKEAGCLANHLAHEGMRAKEIAGRLVNDYNISKNKAYEIAINACR